MSKFRKKPVVVEAFKLDGNRPYPAWFNDAFEEGIVDWRGSSEGTHLVIQTLEGEMIATEGHHYIIKGVQGEIYPCRVDIFEATYEAVEGQIATDNGELSAG